MKCSGFTEDQIIGIYKEQASGLTVAYLCGGHDV